MAVMGDDFRHEVVDLCRAARELLTSFDRQDAQAAAARERAEASRAAFDRLMETYRSGGDWPSGAERSRTLLEAIGPGASMDSVCEEMRASVELSRRWEAAFCDIYESLIRLNAYPEVRDGVAGIAGQVRAIRLLQVVPDELEPPIDADIAPVPPAPLGLGEFFAGDGHPTRAERFSAVMRGMGEYTHRVGDVLPEREVLTRKHLEDLLAAAEALG